MSNQPHQPHQSHSGKPQQGHTTQPVHHAPASPVHPPVKPSTASPALPRPVARPPVRIAFKVDRVEMQNGSEMGSGGGYVPCVVHAMEMSPVNPGNDSDLANVKLVLTSTKKGREKMGLETFHPNMVFDLVLTPAISP